MRKKKVMVVVLCALLVFGALAIADVSLGQQKVLADETTFDSTASDATLYRYDSDYFTAQSMATGNVDHWSDWTQPGQFNTTNPGVGRGALFFDTNSLPDSAVITSATLSLYLDSKSGTPVFDVIVVDGSSLEDPPAASDYGYLGGKDISGGAVNTASLIVSDYNDIHLNAIGMGWISKTGMTKFGLRSSRDIGTIPPTTGNEFMSFHSYEEGSEYWPKLVVTYYVPTASVPTLSQWGMIGMAIVLAAFLAWSVRRRWVVSANKS